MSDTSESPPREKSATPRTIDLLNKALETGDSERELSRLLKLGSSTLGVARHRGRLSPRAAGTLAAHLGLDPTPWMALAALEAEAPNAARDTLSARVRAAVGKSLATAAAFAAAFVGSLAIAYAPPAEAGGGLTSDNV